jgi:anti-sigma factor RsiW
MKPHRNAPEPLPPDLLAAYLDGELAEADRLQVEAWLAGHPEAQPRIDAQRELMAHWESTQAEEPAETAWASVLDGIRTGLDQQRSAAPVHWPSGRTAIRVTAAAAAVFLILAVDRVGPPDSALAPAEPFPVTLSEDVDIVSVHGRDSQMLVVGELPVDGPLILAANGDVHVQSVRPDVDGMIPLVVLEQANIGTPMIVAPLGSIDSQGN